MRQTGTVLLLALLAGSSVAQEATSATAESVRELADAAAKAASCEAQQGAFDRIEEIGCAAVPSLVAYAGDRRALSCAMIKLRNKSPNAFEAARHYSPRLVGEAVQALLNQITGQHYGAVYNGGTDSELEASAAQWRAYVAHTPSARVCRWPAAP